MTPQEIKARIAAKITGQGNQVDIGNGLSEILNEIIDLIPEMPETVLMVQSANNTTVGGFSVPALTVEQVQQAYNAVVAGRGCIIIDKDETMHAYVNQADALNDELSIAILFYSSLILTYTITGGAVVITHVEL